MIPAMLGVSSITPFKYLFIILIMGYTFYVFDTFFYRRRWIIDLIRIFMFDSEIAVIILQGQLGKYVLDICLSLTKRNIKCILCSKLI